MAAVRCQEPAVNCQILESCHNNLLAWFERDPALRTSGAGTISRHTTTASMPTRASPEARPQTRTAAAAHTSVQ